MGKALKSFAEWRLQENIIEYDFYFKKFKRLLMSMFKWDGLPDGISARFIEDKLFYNGLLIFYKSPALGFYVMAQATPIGLNDYEEPTGYRAYGVNKINEYVKASDCVPLWNDMFIQGNMGNVNFFAKSLSNIKKTFDINLEQLKNPNIISCPEGQKESVKAVLAQKTDGIPYIFVNDDFTELNHVSVFNLKIDNHTKELQDVSMTIENEGMTFFGIQNVNVAKKERLITGEAEQNDEQISINKDSMYDARKMFVAKANAKFNLNPPLTVFTKEDIEKNKKVSPIKKAGDNIGNE
jgi:hypothetical protein